MGPLLLLVLLLAGMCGEAKAAAQEGGRGIVIEGETGRNQGIARMHGCCCTPPSSKLTPTNIRTLSTSEPPPSLQQPETSTRKGCEESWVQMKHFVKIFVVDVILITIVIIIIIISHQASITCISKCVRPQRRRHEHVVSGHNLARTSCNVQILRHHAHSINDERHNQRLSSCDGHEPWLPLRLDVNADASEGFCLQVNFGFESEGLTCPMTCTMSPGEQKRE